MNSLNMLEQPIILYYWHYQTPPTPLPPPRPPLPIQRPISPPPLPPPPPVKIVFSQLLEEQKDFVEVHNCINIFDWFKGMECDNAAAAHTFPSFKSHNSFIQLSHHQQNIREIKGQLFRQSQQLREIAQSRRESVFINIEFNEDDEE